jgi:hypothetical protein
MKDKKELCTPEGSEQSRPFFARFLEGQDTQRIPSRHSSIRPTGTRWINELSTCRATTVHSNK